jgi:hypothetical protein
MNTLKEKKSYIRKLLQNTLEAVERIANPPRWQKTWMFSASQVDGHFATASLNV